MTTIEIIEERLFNEMLAGQRSVDFGEVEIEVKGKLTKMKLDFELLPVLARDTQERREGQARREAKKLIGVLLEE